MDETNFDTEWKWNFVLEEMKKKFETFYIASGELCVDKGWPDDMERNATVDHGAESGTLIKGLKSVIMDDQWRWVWKSKKTILDSFFCKLRSIWTMMQRTKSTVFHPTLLYECYL